jgi:hypothetical protein
VCNVSASVAVYSSTCAEPQQQKYKQVNSKTH